MVGLAIANVQEGEKIEIDKEKTVIKQHRSFEDAVVKYSLKIKYGTAFVYSSLVITVIIFTA